MTGVDEASLLVIVGAAALASVLVLVIAPRLVLPVVVLELLLGIVVGPQVLDLAQIDPTTDLFGDLGLGMLFFFAGYEIDFERIRGRPLALATSGWLLSLGIAYGLAGILFAGNVIDSDLYTGSALATTAIGTLIPILRDSGELRTRFGTQLLAAGALGEFGPIMLVTIVLTTRHPIHEALILILFIMLAVFTGVVAVRSTIMGWPVLERTFEASGQLAVRLAVVLVFGLVALATELGLDLLLGGFVAGMITRLALRGREVALFESKLTAIGYGFLIPFFFVVSGMGFDAKGLVTSPSALAKLPLFAAFFLIVRGVPALLFYRRELDLRNRVALGFFCATELPLVVAITALAKAHHDMRASTVSALVGAAIISTLLYPLIGLRLRRART
jgi:Kef-type K+ transport system membrane component KefB